MERLIHGMDDVFAAFGMGSGERKDHWKKSKNREAGQNPQARPDGFGREETRRDSVQPFLPPFSHAGNGRARETPKIRRERKPGANGFSSVASSLFRTAPLLRYDCLPPTIYLKIITAPWIDLRGQGHSREHEISIAGQNLPV